MVSIPVDSLVVNQFFENREDCPCDRCRRDAERNVRHVREIDAEFELLVSRLPELAGEAQGIDALAELGPRLLATGARRET